MAALHESQPVSDGMRRVVFRRMQQEGYDYMVEAEQCSNDGYAVTTGNILRGVRAGHVREDLTQIYNAGGRVQVAAVTELKGDFDAARRGGLELLPMAGVIAVERDMAVAEYKRQQCQTRAAAEDRPWWKRAIDALGDVRPGL